MGPGAQGKPPRRAGPCLPTPGAQPPQRALCRPDPTASPVPGSQSSALPELSLQRVEGAFPAIAHLQHCFFPWVAGALLVS